MKTKDRILRTVIKVFNEEGYHANSLTNLAHHCEMSRGNLAYHYKDKEAILYDIATLMSQDITDIRKKRRPYPAFENLSLDIQTCSHLQEQYTFAFRDMSILEHDSIKTVMHNWSKEVIKSNMDAFCFGVEVGNIHPEPYEGLYYQLALNAWLVSYYWVAQEAVRDMGKEKPEVLVWSTIYPHFTDKGKKAFKKFYGEEFLSTAGIPLQQYIDLKHII